MTTLKTRARIFVLAILAALPALLLTVYSAVERRASTENQACAELRRLVKLAAMQQWQVVEGARQMMVASSQILFTLLSDRKRCTEYFAGLFAQNREAYGDIACRYGGEEFALILPETNLDAVLRRAEDVRLAIARLGLSHAGTPLGKITTPLGIALFPDHGEDTDALLRVADMALYAAKGAGRNRVVVGSAEKS